MSRATWNWTDELVKEFCKGVIDVQFAHPHDVNIMNGMRHFKESKQQSENKDYEILSHGVGLPNPIILRVKRLSDNEIFSVGDKIEGSGLIKEFVVGIRTNAMGVVFSGTSMRLLEDISKEKKKPILFTTEQREEIISIIKTFIK